MNRKVFILSGISGAGKSTYAKTNHPNDLVVSADHYFMKNGVYVFDHSKLGEAHAECLRLFVEAVRVGDRRIVVDNTNTSVEEIAPYYLLAKAYGYDVEIVEIRVPSDRAFKRCIHEVSLSTINRMNWSMFNRQLPSYWDVKVIEIEGS